MIVKEYMLSKEELKRDFPIGSKHIIDGKEVVVTEIHDPMTANCMASYPMVFFEEVASIQNYETNHTNTDRIRNMSNEELVEFIQEVESTCFVDFIGYADKDCGKGKISCKDCRAKAPTILDWLQSEAE